MTSQSFTCHSCGDAFTMPAATLARYPGWTPRTCGRCRVREQGGASISRRGGRAVGGGGFTGRPGGLTTAEVLGRYHAGPDTGVFTDGSCSGNPGPGGWGAVRVRDGKVIAQRHGSEANTTNNRMELVAMAEGLSLLGPDEEADVYSDSRLVVDTLTKWAPGWERRGWRRSGGAVANLDLVQRAYALLKERPRAHVRWIRAHDGSRWNEYADALATAYLREAV